MAERWRPALAVLPARPSGLARLRCEVNRRLDRLVRAEVRVGSRSLGAFQLCGAVGLAVAVLLAEILATVRGLSPWTTAALAAAALLTFLVLAMATKIVSQRERLVYYHHQIASAAVIGSLLRLTSQPVLAYLDLTLVGLGALLACGRIGCLMVGCCHGRPHAWGVRYREEHAAAGFSSHLVGARLMPIQAIEALWALGIAVVGSALVLADRPPGTAAAWCAIAYGVGRFAFEFERGDATRRYAAGFSEAQWTSLALIGATVAAELAGLVPAAAWHPAAAAGVALAMAGVALRRRSRPTRHELLHPVHVREIASALDLLSGLTALAATTGPGLPARRDVHVGSTSLGLRVSAGQLVAGGSRLDHYALSSERGQLTEEGAGALAELIRLLKHPTGREELIRGDRGVFHVLIRPGSG